MESQNYGSAAWELAFNTAKYGPPDQLNYEKRNIAAAAQLLGFDVSVDPDTGEQTFYVFSGAPDFDAMSQFLNDYLTRTGVGTPYARGPDPLTAGLFNVIIDSYVQQQRSQATGLLPTFGQGAIYKILDQVKIANAQISPLVLDLTGGGINLTPLSDGSPYFDLAGDGFARKTGWIGTGSGLLCIDSSDSGQITSINQLFGNATTNGFTVLKGLDSNNDGVIDSNDADFGQLRVWVDSNSNGVVNPGELFTLSQLGIASISLSYSAASQTIAGNSIDQIGSYTLTDGTTREIADAWFSNSATFTQPDTAVAISSVVAAMPQLSGYGTVTDLHSALMSDATLQSDLNAFINDEGTRPPSLAPLKRRCWSGAAQPMSLPL